MIKVGDLVIKNTGGNKMKVISIVGNQVECVWLTERFNQSFFDLKELLPISQSDSIFKRFHREDVIDNLLK